MKLRIFALGFVLGAIVPTGAAAAPPQDDTTRTRAHLPSKPTGPIAADFRLTAQPEVGVPLEIAVTARVEPEVTGVRIEATPTAPGAVLVSTPVLLSSGEGRYEWTIAVVPLAAEAGYLGVLVSGSSAGTPQAHAVTVPLRSTAALRAPQGAAEPGGENLIALPVQETP